MKICEECKHSTVIQKPRKAVRICTILPGKPLCLNAREAWWERKNQERECGPNGNLWERK